MCMSMCSGGTQAKWLIRTSEMPIQWSIQMQPICQLNTTHSVNVMCWMRERIRFLAFDSDLIQFANAKKTTHARAHLCARSAHTHYTHLGTWTYMECTGHWPLSISSSVSIAY